MRELLLNLSTWSVPLIFLFVFIFAYIKDVSVYDSFTAGARDGFKTLLNIFPNLLAMIMAIRIFQYSGAMNFLINLLAPLFNRLNVPEPVIPLLFLRSLSGSGSLSYINELFTRYGPDSFIGKLASTVQGSTETTFYIIAVYFGAVGIKKYRYSVFVGILADLAGFFAAVFICDILF